MRVNGTLMNYYFHCKRQCYLHGNRLNLEDNSELVQIGRVIHEVKAQENESAEIAIDNIRLDRLTAEYLTEIKKSDADVEAAKWQLYYYLKEETELEQLILQIEELLSSETVPEAVEKPGCKKCSYYEYCFI